MIQHKLFSIKVYITINTPIECIASVVPTIIANSFKTCMAISLNNTPYPIGYDASKLIEFQINLGTIINTQNFEYLYTTMLQFLSSYSYVYSAYRYFIKFTEEDLIKYKKTCDSFKDKQWDDIVSDFSDATHDLVSNATIGNNKII